jgi:hypothetical protein
MTGSGVGRGKGGKGLGKGGAKRHRKILRDNIQGEQHSFFFYKKGLYNSLKRNLFIMVKNKKRNHKTCYSSIGSPRWS